MRGRDARLVCSDFKDKHPKGTRMRVGKKLVVVASLLATGVSTAVFFRKDASQTEPRQEATRESPFRDRVERRVAAGAAWAQGLRARRSNQSLPATRVPSATT